MNKRDRGFIRSAVNDIREKMSESGATGWIGQLPDEADCWKWAKDKGLCSKGNHLKALSDYGERISASLPPPAPGPLWRGPKRAKKTKSKKPITVRPAADFYLTWEWKKVRYETIKKWGAVCMCCGSVDRIVVDHIKPRSKFPRLSLDLNNLQILCNDCNMGKSNDDYTDWRPV